MPVNKGLKTIAGSSPNFSNATTLALITAVTGSAWVPKQKTMVDKSVASEVITNSNRTALQSALNTNSYQNINDWLPPLDTHTQAILAGTLGEPDGSGQTTFDYTPERGTFLDHLSSVQNFTSSIPNLYGVTADSLNKGINGHFGSLAGYLDATLNGLKEAIDIIVSMGLTEQTSYESAMQDVSDYIDTLSDSTVFNSATWDGLMTALTTAGNNLNTKLSTSAIAGYRTTIVNAKSTIETQITLETTNLGAIRTYEDSLTTIYRYLNYVGDTEVNNLIVRTSQNSDWQTYFKNYDSNFQTINPLFDTSSNETQKVNTVLGLKRLPDVTQYLDLESVAKKALKDSRLKSKLKDSGKTDEEVIKDSCEILGINTIGRNVYTLSKMLLKSMQDHDRSLIEDDLSEHKDTNTIS